MKNPKISVILPVYNVEDYLEETLNSLLNQSFIENMEILMIDDGSTDNSRYIIEKYALDYENFHSFHKKNEGLSITRNFGIEHANGEYVGFIDSDDLISFDGYEKLYNLAIENDSDIVTSNFRKFGRYNSWQDIISKNVFGNLNHDIKSTTLQEMPKLVWDTIVCNKLFKKEFLDGHNIRFPNKKILYEDIPVSLKSYILAENVSISHDIFYFWRVRRSNNLSITQQRDNVKNFYDRIEIINMCRDIFDEELISNDILCTSYSKWLNHDLFLFLKKFNNYPKESSNDLLEKIKDILNIIPEEIKNDLNSFKKICYKMVENNEVDSLNYFLGFNEELKENPHIPPELDDKYLQYFNFIDDASNEELIVKAEEFIDYDDENIFIEFKDTVNYLNYEHLHETKATLIDSNNNEYPLEINNNIFKIPINLIKDKGHLNIKMEYIVDEFRKKSFLQNSKRQIISYEGFDVEIGIESSRIFCIDTRLTNDNEIKINNLSFDDDTLNFKGVSCEKIDEVYLQNVVTFERLFYPVTLKSCNDIYEISFSIPHEDILKYPIDKWEIGVNDLFKSITIPKRFVFFTEFNRMRIINARNKILIENDLYDKFQTLSEYYEEIQSLNNIKKELTSVNRKLNKENKKLIKNNSKLEKKNENLNNLVEDYKSRFAVRSADKIKHIVNNK